MPVIKIIYINIYDIYQVSKKHPSFESLLLPEYDILHYLID